MPEEFRFPNIATPPGSSAYYLVRFSPPGLRDRQAVLFAWRRELQRLLNSSDPGVARIKLDYWRRELQPAQRAQSRHPLAQLIHALLSDEASRLIDLADLTEQEILAGVSRDWEEVIEREGLEVLYGGPVHWPHSTSWYVQDPTGWEIEVALWNDDVITFDPAEG